MRKALFETWAGQQGVLRPFQALCEMDAASRKQIADMLNVNLNDAWENGCNQALYDLNVLVHELRSNPEEYEQTFGELPYDPEQSYNKDQAEACLIIGQDRKGIQARSHSTLKTIAGSENHTWPEVLVSVIQEFKIECHVAGKTEEQLESAIFDHFAEQEWDKKGEEERQEIEKFINDQPELIEKLKVAGLNTNKRRWIVNLMFQAAKQGGFNTYITAVKVAGWMNRTIGTKVMMKTVTKGLATVLRTVNVALWAWLVWDVLAFFFGPSRKRLIPVIALIHQHYLLEKIEALDDAPESRPVSAIQLVAGSVVAILVIAAIFFV